MKAVIRQLLVASFVTACISVPVSAHPSSPVIESATRINAANSLVREAKVAEAIAIYQQVSAAEANRNALNYNLAVAQYSAGEIEAAKARFTQSAASADTSLAARSRFNLGNCFYNDAVKAAEQDKPTAIESLREAISHYRGSLAGNPHNVDARANIELAGELIKKLQDEQKQARQQQNQDQQQQQDQQQSEQDSESQTSDSSQDPSEQNDQQGDSDSENNSNQQEKSSESKPDDQRSGQPQQKPTDSQQPQDSESKAEPAQNQDSKSSDQPAEQPSPAERDSSDNPAKNQSSTQPTELQDQENEQAAQGVVPAGELTAAGEQDADGTPHGRVTVADPNVKDGLMTQQEALKMLQAVRDRDMLRRLKQEQAERNRHITVDRDW